MRAPKKPPPDTEGNLRGRMGLLRTTARQGAQVDKREGADYERALAKRMKAIEPQLVKLRARFARAHRLVQAPRNRREPSGPVEIPPSKRVKTDLLDELGAL